MLVREKNVFFLYYIKKFFYCQVLGVQLSTKYAAIWGVSGDAALSIGRGGAGASKRSAELSTKCGRIWGKSQGLPHGKTKSYKVVTKSYKTVTDC